MDIVNRLKLFLEKEQIAITQFADNCGIPRPTLSQFLNLRNKKVSDDFIRKIHDAYPELSVLWLMFGEGNMYANAPAKQAPPSGQTSEGNHDRMQSMEFDMIDSGEKETDDTSGSDSDSQLDRPGTSSSPVPGTTMSIDFGPTVSEREGEFDDEQGDREQTADDSDRTLTNGNEDQTEATIPEEIANSITFHDEPKRKIVNIIVYYSDNSFESFGPMKPGR